MKGDKLMNEDLMFDSYLTDMDESVEGVYEGALGQRAKNFGKKIWIAIKTFFRKAVQFFRNCIMNVNMFKEALLPAQMNQDLQLVCQNAAPKYQYTQNVALFTIKQLKLLKQQQGSIIVDATIENQTIPELEVAISSNENTYRELMDSDEYRRIKENKYDTNDLQKVPISNVVANMKKTTQQLISYEGHVDKLSIEAGADYIPQTFRSLLRATANLFSKACSLYRIQITMYSIYFEKAKASLAAIKDNIKEIKDKSVDVNREYGYGLKSYKDAFNYNKKNLKESNKNLSKESQVMPLIEQCISFDNDPAMFEEYTRIRNEICKILQVSPNSVIKYSAVAGYERGFNVLPERRKAFKLLSTTQIYHTSVNDALTELTGKYCFHVKEAFLTQRCLFKDPRVYFSISKSILANGIDTQRAKEMGVERYTYVPKQRITTVFKDPEFHLGGACYVPATSIPVMRID